MVEISQTLTKFNNKFGTSLLGRALPASAHARPKTMKYVSHYGGWQYVCQKDAANKNHFDLILGVGHSLLHALSLSTYLRYTYCSVSYSLT